MHAPLFTAVRRGNRASLVVVVLALGFAPPAWAGTGGKVSKDDEEQKAEAPSRPADMPLSLLPDPPRLELPAPRPASLEAIDGLLARLVSGDATVRENASRELLEVKPDWVSGLSKRIDRIAERADKTGMRALLEKLRTKHKRRAADDESSVDYLEFALASPDPDSAIWRDLVQTLAVSRMLRHIGNADAVRELIRVYVRFGEFLRVDTQLQLEALGERAVAGLIEAKRHQAPKISSWAEKRLDLLGKSIPHEAVRTKDPAALAEILVALGRTRDPDATRVLISFASTERAQIRHAARQGLALLGDVAAWQLRDAYLDTTGKHPPREWTWKRTARELFTEYDRLRLAKVFEVFEEARKAEGAGDLAKMKEGYDQVLAWSPLFEQRELMASGYLAFANAKKDDAPDAAISALRRVERIAEKDEDRKRAESLRHVLEARRLREGGFVDRGLVDKAIALDPTSELARDELGQTAIGRESPSFFRRYLLAGVVGLVSLGGVAFMAFGSWRKRRTGIESDETNAPDAESDPDFPADEAPSAADELASNDTTSETAPHERAERSGASDEEAPEAPDPAPGDAPDGAPPDAVVDPETDPRRPE